MDILQFSLNATLPVVLCMALGIFLRMRGMFSESLTNGVSKLCFQVFLPTLTFYNVYQIDFRAEFSMRFVGVALLGILVVPLLLLVILAPIVKDREWAAAMTHVGFRTNYIMFGVPMATNMFGELGSKVASMLVPVAVIPFNIITLILFGIAGSHKGDSVGKIARNTFLNLVKNPLIIGSMLGLVFSLAQIPFPPWGLSTLKNISGVASPLCLITLGAQVSLNNLKADALRVWLMTATRLVFVPLVMLSAMVALGFRGAQLGALFVLFASPCANSSVIMAQQYQVKAVFTAQVVAMTTVLSGLTTFLGISLLRWLQLF